MTIKNILIASLVIIITTYNNLSALEREAAIKESSINYHEKDPYKKFKRKHLHFVGSSTVYPFATIIAEDFGRINKIGDKNAKTPIIEANGTGGGFKLFCQGVGEKYPDFVNASRPIEKSEIANCLENNIKNPIEINIGYDGIVLANKITGFDYNINLEQLFLALIAEIPDNNGNIKPNQYKYWSDIDKKLPKIAIKIYGPPTSSGTRDSFVEMAIENPCNKNQLFIKSYPDPKIRKQKCRIIRNDGAFIEAGENDNLIVHKLINDKDAMGIFGFNFLRENNATIKAVKLDNQIPNIDNISSGQYPISRPLFIYAKQEHLNIANKMPDFIKEILSDETIGSNGSLAIKGLIPLSKQALNNQKSNILKKIDIITDF